MTKEFNYSVFILLAVLLFLLLQHPLEMLINNFSTDAVRNELLSGAFTRLLICGGLLLFMHKKGFFTFNGLAPVFTMRNIWLLVIPVFVTALMAFSNIETFNQTKGSMLLLFGFNAAVTGVLEEFTIRGTVLPLMLKHFSKSKHTFFKAMLLSSLLFGIAHFIGLVRHPDNFSGILSQVIFAIGIGFFLAALLFRTQNIVAPIIVHFLINFTGGVYRLKENGNNDTSASEAISLFDYIPVLVLSFALVFVGVYIVRKIEKEEWIKRISFIKL
ncbi:MAG: CPBP family intramembrane metalloprotease [Chitinophagaceae bacterium]|nr:MAG: CPBP family intramembrane metalloprotease [Chitinophagaceae bacterium]